MQSFELYGDDEDFSDREIQEFEKDLLGFYVTSHPLESIRDKLPFLTTHNISDLDNVANDTFVTVCGLLTSVRQIRLQYHNQNNHNQNQILIQNSMNNNLQNNHNKIMKSKSSCNTKITSSKLFLHC